MPFCRHLFPPNFQLAAAVRSNFTLPRSSFCSDTPVQAEPGTAQESPPPYLNGWLLEEAEKGSLSSLPDWNIAREGGPWWHTPDYKCGNQPGVGGGNKFLQIDSCPSLVNHSKQDIRVQREQNPLVALWWSM